jgi:hypothetical protein
MMIHQIHSQAALIVAQLQLASRAKSINDDRNG